MSFAMVPLGDLCEVLDSKRKPITKRDREPGPYPYYGATGIRDHVAGFIFNEPLVLVGEDGAKWGSGDATAFSVEGKTWINNHAHVLKPDRRRLLDRWLINYLNFSDLSGFVSGLTVPKLNQASLREIPVPLPDVSEQLRIVAILDEAFAGIATAKANAEKCVKNGRELFARELDDLIQDPRWEWRTIGDLCDKVEYGTSAKSKPQGKVAVLRMGNIQSGKLNWENLVYSDDKDEISKYLLHPGDVLFNRTNSPELVGKTAIYNGEQPAIFAGYLIRVHRKQNVLSAEFLCYFLNSRFALDHGKTVMTSSVHQANISGSKLLAYRIPAPSLRQQQYIVEKLDSLRAETHHLEALYTRKLAAIDELRQSLLHQAFSGQL